MDIFKTPGGSLLGGDKTQFDDLKLLVDKATNEFLIKSDWEANMACVDKVNALVGPHVLPEIVFYLRRKLGTKDPKLIVYTMHLVESFVNNCGIRFHAAMNDDKFMKEVGNVARKFSAKMGEDNREAAEVTLDLVQAWGEAFLPKQVQYPHITKLYFDLRKEGLHFKEKQFDPNRVPIASESIGKGRHTGDRETDGILAAAMQAQMNVRRNEKQYDEKEDDDEDFSASFYQGELSGGNPQPQRSGQRPAPTTRGVSVSKKDSFDPSMYPGYDFNDNGRPPVQKQKSTKPGNKRDSFDPSMYPGYDFSESGPPPEIAAQRQKTPVSGKSKRDSFDPSQYPDYNFNEDPHAHNLAISSVKPTSVTAEEVINSVTFSLAILRDLILACTHEREVRNNEVAEEVAQQVTVMESKMSEVIENALTNQPERVEELFTLNEEAQMLLSVFNALSSGSIALAQAKAKIAKTHKPAVVTVTPIQTARASPAHDLIGYEEHSSHRSSPSHSHRNSPHQNAPIHHQHHQQYQQAPPHQQYHQQQYQQAPVPHYQQQPQPQRSTPSTPTARQPVQQTAAPPPQSSAKKTPAKLAPPPSVDSIYGMKASDSDIIQVEDPFAPDALDNLFEDPAVVRAKLAASPPTQTPAKALSPPTTVPGTAGHQTSAQQAAPEQFDPFSPAALDALFEKGPVVPAQKSAAHDEAVLRAKQQVAAAHHIAEQQHTRPPQGPQRQHTQSVPAGPQRQNTQNTPTPPVDPFSEDALDALFDYDPNADHNTAVSTTPARSIPPTPVAHDPKMFSPQSPDYYNHTQGYHNGPGQQYHTPVAVSHQQPPYYTPQHYARGPAGPPGSHQQQPPYGTPYQQQQQYPPAQYGTPHGPPGTQPYGVPYQQPPPQHPQYGSPYQQPPQYAQQPYGAPYPPPQHGQQLQQQFAYPPQYGPGPGTPTSAQQYQQRQQQAPPQGTPHQRNY